MPADVARQVGRPTRNPIIVNRDLLKPIPEISAVGGAGGGSASRADSATAKSAANHASNDWLDLNTVAPSSASDAHGISSPWQPAKTAGGGARLLLRA